MLNFFSYSQLSKNRVRTLLSLRPLGTLFVFLLVSSFPAFALPHNETNTPKTFADWCLNKNQETAQTRHTVDVLLQVAKTTDCHQASELLSTRTELDLNENQIADLKPLSNLTNLTNLALISNSITDLEPLSNLTNLSVLSLSNNSIADLKPLSNLTNLTKLFLNGNKITDLKPLSNLTNLTRLSLKDNSIANIKPLSTLTKLELLSLNNNSSLTDKTCPVKPESICIFLPLQSD